MANFVPLGIKISQIRQLQSRIAQKIIKNLDDLKVDNINAAQMNIIFQLWQKDDISISEVSKSTKLANTTLTNMLERLANMGLITKYSNPLNKRETMIKLTEKSLHLKNSYNDLAFQMKEINFEGFSQDEIEQLMNYLERIKNNLEKWESEK